MPAPRWGVYARDLDDVYLFPGDLVFVRSPSLLGKLIRFFTRGEGESPTETNHVAGVVEGGPAKNGASSAQIVEALWHVRRGALYDLYKDSDSELQVWRCGILGGDDAANVVVEVEKQVGEQYGVLKIVLQLGDSLLARALHKQDVYFFRAIGGLKSFPICSFLWARAYDVGARITFGVPVNAATPDDMLDWCVAHNSWWRVV
jgi:hypothetical protein